MKSIDLIAVDLGNSRISCGLFRQGILLETWHHATNSPAAAAAAIAEKSDSKAVAISSVVPETAKELRAHLTAAGKSLIDVRSEAQSMVKGVYDTLGTDRLANAIAVWKLYGKSQPALAIDLGTATTLTAISASGEFLGGLITLGLGRIVTSLHAQAAQLPAVNFPEADGQALGFAFDTPSSISNGTILAQIGLVEHWVKVGRKALGNSTIAVATGGWSSLLASYTSVLDFVDPHLTLKGIYLIAEQAMDQADRD
jgi:type III pantothenate kinase